MKRTTIPAVLAAMLGLLLASCGTATEEATSDAAESDTASDANSSQDGGGESGDTTGADDAAVDETASVTQGEGSLRSSVLGVALDTTTVSSAQFEGTIEVTGTPDSEVPGTFIIDFSGAYDIPNNASRLSMDLSEIMAAAAASEPDSEESLELFGPLLEEPIQVITIGETSWTKWGLLSLFGVEDQWLEAGADDSESLTSDLAFGGLSPTDLLDSLADAEADIKEVGQEEIRGVQTTNYQADLDLATLVQTMSPEERAEFESDLGATADGQYQLGLWVDGNGLLHRFELDGLNLTKADEQPLESIYVLYEIWDHGADPAISPPPADQVVTETDLGFDLEDVSGLSG